MRNDELAAETINNAKAIFSYDGMTGYGALIEFSIFMNTLLFMIKESNYHLSRYFRFLEKNLKENDLWKTHLYFKDLSNTETLDFDSEVLQKLSFHTESMLHCQLKDQLIKIPDTPSITNAKDVQILLVSEKEPCTKCNFLIPSIKQELINLVQETSKKAMVEFRLLYNTSQRNDNEKVFLNFEPIEIDKSTNVYTHINFNYDKFQSGDVTKLVYLFESDNCLVNKLNKCDDKEKSKKSGKESKEGIANKSNKSNKT